MAKKSNIQKTAWQFDIGKENYDLSDHGRAYKPVLLDGKEIYRLDQTLYMGHKRDFTKAVLDAIKKKTGFAFTKDQLQRAITIGILEK